MRAVMMFEFGGPEVLEVRHVPDPVPGSGQVLVAVEFAGVVFVETQIRGGRGPAAKNRPPLPRTPGNGVGGMIVAVGPDVDPALRGTVVVTPTGGTGGYAEFALAAVGDLVPVPAGLELRDAVALLSDGRTALLVHQQVQVQPGERVLVTAAGGGLGGLLVQLAADAGAHVIGAARGSEKGGLVESLGARHYVDYAQPDWARQVTEATDGAGVDVVLDGVGGELGTTALSLVRPGGRASIHGMASGTWAEADEDKVTVVGGSVPTPAEARALSIQALALAAEGRLRPVIGQTFPLADAAAAHRAIETRATTGKTLLVP
ncbi:MULTISPECIES: zinc-binding dehydrogenase [Streptomyces]|uniref:zinc-binding dehydrogenase n=1 Tax=Streptomyces TaxID=1883 RepID=UPI000B915CEE|nr:MULTISPECIES: zinc-binding dehydrogenase [Streptomyces]OXZ01569.1 NADPH:quinone reductase [Streptomyces sp. 2R]WSR90004.1 zinc-binding dehydrogenase [Streptomyces microflavus]WTF67998.1 zinc-binding dehydrogenase [Streptomyces microflavus]